VFNVGRASKRSVNDLAAAIGRASGREIKVDHIDRRDIDNIRRRVVNIEKIRLMLRWSPQVALDRGLAETVRWFEDSACSRHPRHPRHPPTTIGRRRPVARRSDGPGRRRPVKTARAVIGLAISAFFVWVTLSAWTCRRPAVL